MIWLTWRQFRAEAAVALGALAAVAIALAITGPHIVHIYDTAVVACRASPRLLRGPKRVLEVRPAPAWRPEPTRDLRARSHRDVLGGAAGRARDRRPERSASPGPRASPKALARGKTRGCRPGLHGRRRAAQPHGHLVGEPDRPGEREPAVARGFRRARHRPGQLRLRRRSHRWADHPPDGTRPGRHPGRVLRRPPGDDLLGATTLRDPPTLARNYWPFQWYETAIFLGAALILGGFCIWWVRRSS